MRNLVRFCQMLESPPKSCRLSMCPFPIGPTDLIDLTDPTTFDPPEVVSIGALVSLAAYVCCFQYYRWRSSGYLSDQH
jgi:hypothetical protein